MSESTSRRIRAIAVASLFVMSSLPVYALGGSIDEMQRVLQARWKSPSSCPRGFVVLTFIPSNSERPVTVHNSSQDKQFDEAAKTLVDQLMDQSWNVPARESWEIVMRSDGTVKVQVQPPVDFGPYMQDLQRRIKKHWEPPRGQETRRVQIIFKIHADGKMSNLRISRSSGLNKADDAALKAAEAASPLRPLPEGAPDDVDIEFTFDYNVYSGGSWIPATLTLPTKAEEEQRIERDQQQKQLAREAIDANRAIAQSLLPEWDARNWSEALRIAEQFKFVDTKYTESPNLAIWYVRFYAAKKLKLGKKQLDAAVKLYGYGFDTPQKRVAWLDNNALCRDEARRLIQWWTADKHDELP